jgi:CHAT domain-containing protein
LRTQPSRGQASRGQASRGAPSSTGRPRTGGRVPAALVDALGERGFVELIRLDDTLLAVTVAAGRCRLRELGSYERAVGAARVLRFEAHRLARREAAGDTRDPAMAGIAAAAYRLDAQLLRPLRRVLGDRELVIAPTGKLHGLPWPALPGLSGRPLSIVPSAGAWLRAAEAVEAVDHNRVVEGPAGPMGSAGAAEVRTDGHTVLVAGPGLPHAEPEIAALRALYPGANVLTGAAAQAEPVRAAMDGAGLVHLATHGDFRADNALFSSLRLADGPLWAYDLEALHRAPRRVVLAACDAGRAEVHAGEAVVGIAGVLLGFGARTVVASVTPVGDEATGALMRGLHRRLAAGVPPARALADTPRPPGAIGFVCFGAG